MTKKLISLLAIVALMLSMSAVCFADEGPATGTLVVKGDELTDKMVYVYQVFSVNWDDKNSDSKMNEGDNISYVLNSDWDDFFTETMLNGINGVSKSDKAAQYIATADDAKLLQIAKEMKTYLEGHSSIQPTVTPTAAVNDQVSYTVTSGYYLVIPESGSTSADRQTDATLLNVPSNESASWEIKSEYPTVEKTIDGETEADARIGEEITFTLESKIPDLTEYANTPYYTFRFKDTFSEGLTFSGTEYVQVKLIKKNNDTVSVDLVNPDDFLPEYNSDTKQLTVTLGKNKTVVENEVTKTVRDLKTLLEEKTRFGADDIIVITYKAKLNENAIVYSETETTNYNTNSAKVEYSNDPDDETSIGESTPSVTETYTYPINIYKHNEANEPLAGAVFQLKDNNGTVIDLVLKTAADGANPAVYRVAKFDDTQKVNTITTPANGKLKIEGLEAGTFSLEETTAPTGYNKLGSPITFTISPTNNGTEAAPEYDYSDPVYTINGTENDDATIDVENTKGTLLPTTGSIGTIGLTALGVCVVVFGFVFTSRKKKKAE